MYDGSAIAVIIPALNEAQALPRVLAAIPDWVDDVIVVDNGSTDGTDTAAQNGGARVIREPRRGYGAACLAGIAEARDADILVFLDADFSDHPQQMERLVAPIARGCADLVIGSRVRGARQPGALNAVQRMGNAVACRLMRVFWRYVYTDLGPFRAVRASSLRCLNMEDRTYGWTVQMQIRALRAGLRVQEVAVDYRRRIGRSKISGTLRGIIGAATRITATVFHERFRAPKVQPHTTRPEHVIVFGRCPLPGQTKTRLIPALGPEGAAALHAQMTAHTLHAVEQLCFADGVSAEMRYTGGSAESMRARFGGGSVALPAVCPFLPQGEGDLGARMHRAIADAYARGARRIVVIGTDCPSIDRVLLEDALAALRTRDCVIGPAADGGYYLIGLRRPAAQVFEGVRWGTDRVLAETLRRLRDAGMSVHLLPQRSDVDEPSDLREWERCKRPAVSVIIPALNEAAWIGEAVRRAIALAGAEAGAVEVLVCDGGSVDETCEITRAAGARVVRAPRGRARQMNAGAAAARGALLLFLHADTLLPPGYADEVQRLVQRPGVVLGAFRLGIDHPGRAFRVVEFGANLRSRLLGMPYGDQAMAIRATDFFRLGGFPDLPFMEDYEFVRRVRHAGRVATAGSRVRTSARRWVQRGVWRLTAIHQACILAYRLGFPAAKIMKWREQRGERTRDAAGNATESGRGFHRAVSATGLPARRETAGDAAIEASSRGLP